MSARDLHVASFAGNAALLAEVESPLDHDRLRLVPPASRADGTIRVFIATDESIFRDGLRKLIESESDLRVVGEAAQSAPTLTAVAELRPDILLLDVSLLRGAGQGLLQAVQRVHPGLRVIVLANSIDRQDIIRALERGARGILLKNSSTALMFKSIRIVHAGEHWVARTTISDLVASLVTAHANKPARAGLGLTARELDVLTLIVAGEPNREIAQQLNITLDTVKHHLTSIFNKTGASNRLELALFAIHHELVASSGGRSPK